MRVVRSNDRRSRTTWRAAALGAAHEVALPAGNVRYHDVGSGPPIVFVHGYAVNANIWRKLVPLLAPRFRCITPDWPLASHVLPVRRDAELSPDGIATMTLDLLSALGLEDAVLWGNDSGGAYAQVAAATRPERIGRLVLNSCETPGSKWPPRGFEMNSLMAANAALYAATWQSMRSPALWRLPSTYGWLAKRAIDREVMESYLSPPIERAEIRHDGRKAISAVAPAYLERAAERLIAEPHPRTLLLWANEDRVFPLHHARDYAGRLGADLRTVDDSYTYTPEDAPEETARLAVEWLEANPCASWSLERDPARM